MTMFARPDGSRTTGKASARKGVDDRTLRRRATVGLMVLPGFSVAAGTLLSPVYGLDDTGEVLAVLATDAEGYRLGLWLGVLAFLTLVPAFLGAGRLARRRRPRLAAVATAVNVVGYLGLGLGLVFLDTMLLLAAQQPSGDRDVLVAFLDSLESSGVFGLGVGLFVIGHVVGAVLMGLALRGSVPTWTWITLALSQPSHFVAFVLLQQQQLDAGTWALTGVALSACALVVLRTPDAEWDLAPAT